MASEDPRQPPEKNLWMRIARSIRTVLVWFFVILIVLVALGWLAFAVFFPQEKLKRVVIEQLHEQLGVSVEVETIEFHLFSGLTLSHLTVGPQPGFTYPALTIERLMVSYSLADLLEDRLVIHEILLDRPKITFELGPTGSNLQALIEAFEKHTPTAPGPNAVEGERSQEFILDLQAVKIRDAAILIQTPNVQADWRGLNLDLSGVLGKNRMTGLKASLQFPAPEDPNLFLTIQAKKISAAVGLDLKLESGKLDQLSVTMGVELRQLKVGASSVHQARLDLVSKADLAHDRLDLTTLTARLDTVPLLEATGVITQLSRSAQAKLEITRLLLLHPAFADVISQLLPGIALSGMAAVERVVFEGGAMTAPHFDGRLVVEGGRLIASGFSAEGSSASINVAVTPQVEDVSVTVQGAVSAASVKTTNVLAASVTGTVSGEIQLLRTDQGYLPGRSSVTLNGWARSLIVPGGIGEKVQVSSRLRVGSVKQESGWLNIVDPIASVEWQAENVRLIDRRLAIGEARGATQFHGRDVRLNAESVTLSGMDGTMGLDVKDVQVAERSVKELRVDADWRELSSTADNDFKHPVPIQVRLVADELHINAAAAQRIEAQISSQLVGVHPDQVPINASFSVSGVSVRRTGKSLVLVIGKPLGLTLVGGLRPATSELMLSRLHLASKDIFDMEANGRFNWRTLDADLSVRTGLIIPSKLRDTLPPDLQESIPSLAGRLELSGHFVGRIPRGVPALDGFPFQAELEIRPVGIGVDSMLFAIQDLSGRMRLEVGGTDPSRAKAEIRLQASSIITTAVAGSNLKLSLDATRAGGDLALDGRVAVAAVDPGSFFTEPLEGVELSLGSIVTGMKELRLNTLQAKIGSLGLQVDLSGQAAWPAGELAWKGLKVHSTIEAQFSSNAPVRLPGSLLLDGQARLSLALRSGADGIFMAQGDLAVAGLDVHSPGWSLDGLQGVVPISQLIALTPKPAFVSRSREIREEGAEIDRRSRIYEEALLPLQERDRSLALRCLNIRDLKLSDLAGNLDITDGQMTLGKVRARFLQGDVVADTAIVFAPSGARRLHVAAALSQINLAGLGTQLSGGSSEVSGNARLDIDLAERKVNAEANMTQIGRSTLRSLLAVIDPSQTDKGVVELRGFLDTYEVSPSRVSLTVRRGQVTIEVVLDMGLRARLAANFIEGFDGDTYRLPSLPIGGILGKYLGF